MVGEGSAGGRRVQLVSCPRKALKALFEKIPSNQALDIADSKHDTNEVYNQLNLFEFYPDSCDFAYVSYREPT